MWPNIHRRTTTMDSSLTVQEGQGAWARDSPQHTTHTPLQYDEAIAQSQLAEQQTATADDLFAYDAVVPSQVTVGTQISDTFPVVDTERLRDGNVQWQAAATSTSSGLNQHHSFGELLDTTNGTAPPRHLSLGNTQIASLQNGNLHANFFSFPNYGHYAQSSAPLSMQEGYGHYHPTRSTSHVNGTHPRNGYQQQDSTSLPAAYPKPRLLDSLSHHPPCSRHTDLPLDNGRPPVLQSDNYLCNHESRASHGLPATAPDYNARSVIPGLTTPSTSILTQALGKQSTILRALTNAKIVSTIGASLSNEEKCSFAMAHIGIFAVMDHDSLRHQDGPRLSDGSERKKSAWVYLGSSAQGTCAFCIAFVTNLVMHEPSKAPVCAQCMQLAAFELLPLHEALTTYNLTGIAAARLLQRLPFLHEDGQIQQFYWRPHLDWVKECSSSLKRLHAANQSAERSSVEVDTSTNGNAESLSGNCGREQRRAALEARRNMQISSELSSAESAQDAQASAARKRQKAARTSTRSHARRPASSSSLDMEAEGSSPCKRAGKQRSRASTSKRIKGKTASTNRNVKGSGHRGAESHSAEDAALAHDSDVSDALITAAPNVGTGITETSESRSKAETPGSKAQVGNNRSMASWMKQQGLMK